MRVAFLGVGRMGRPMASNVARAGHDVVLFNRTRAKADQLAAEISATVAGTPLDATSAADLVVTMLADVDAVRESYDGPDGVLAGLRPGVVAVDMGTTGPDGVAWLDERVRAAGADFVDAPVSGSVGAAESGDLTIMAGGEEAAVATVLPVLRTMGRNVFHLGPAGSGAVMKLAVNGIIFALGQAIAEALVVAERAGIDAAIAYDVFENSAVAAPVVKYRRDQYLQPEVAPVLFAMKLAVKDLSLLHVLADRLGAPIAQGDANLASYGRAVADGFGDRDMAALADYLRRAAGP
jgi:3-hydroxyisobutyrate dehydrogenase-like beta-hydroxyacid dehydrogenase